MLAQNLVVDGSFEDTIRCQNQPFTSYLQQSLKYWKYGGYISGISFNSCNWSRYSTPQNDAGYEIPHSGQGYIGIPTFGELTNTPDSRKFATGKLNQTLQANKTYRFSLYVSLSDSLIYSCNNLSIYFSDTIPTFSVYDSYKIQYNLTHPINVNFHQNMSNKVGWTKLDTTFIASGNERYLTIGNFLKDAQSDTNYVGGNTVISGNYYWDYAFLYIDDISVELYDESAIQSSEAESQKIEIYPNPNNGIFTVTSNTNELCNMEVYSMMGDAVFNDNFRSSKQIEVANHLAKGIYLCKVLQNGSVVYQGKIVVQ